MLLGQAKLIEPDKASIREALGRALFLSGRWRRARREFAKVGAAQPERRLRALRARAGVRAHGRAPNELAVMRSSPSPCARAPRTTSGSSRRLGGLTMLADAIRRVPVRPRRGALPRGRTGRRARPRRSRRCVTLGKGIAFVTNNSSRTPETVAARLAVGRDPRRRRARSRRRPSRPRPLLARARRARRLRDRRGGRPARARRGRRSPWSTATRRWPAPSSWGSTPRSTTRSSAGHPCSSSAAAPSSRRTPTPPSRRATANGGREPGPSSRRSRPRPGSRAEVIGKPNAPILRAALARAGGGRPLVIGDRLDTDIAGAVTMGWDSLLVLTGISSRTRTSRGRGSPRPTSADDLSLLTDPD